jgi:hypothetical protein
VRQRRRGGGGGGQDKETTKKEQWNQVAGRELKIDIETGICLGYTLIDTGTLLALALQFQQEPGGMQPLAQARPCCTI